LRGYLILKSSVYFLLIAFSFGAWKQLLMVSFEGFDRKNGNFYGSAVFSLLSCAVYMVGLKCPHL